MSSDSKLQISSSVALQLVGWLVGVLLAYGAMNVRVSVVEQRVNDVRADIQEVKQDVKTLLRRP
jgi:hypothetical protein